MIFSNAQTRYAAQKENPDCFSFHKVEDGYVCFFCEVQKNNWLRNT